QRIGSAGSSPKRRSDKNNNRTTKSKTGHTQSGMTPDSDEMIPGEVRSISKLVDFTKHERNWLIANLKLSTQLIDHNIQVLLNVLNFLSRKEGIFYRYTPRMRGDYDRIFIEPGKHYTFPDQESLAMAHIMVVEAEDPAKLFRLGESREIRGAYGTVYQVFYHNSHAYHNLEMALKKMDHRSERSRRNNLNEIALMRYFKHPNIVSYINSYEMNDEEIWMLMEYMDGGTIQEAIQNFSFTEKYVAYILKQILHALEYLHSLRIAHRDLKSANIMINSKAEVKLVDFGFSIDLTDLGADIHMCGSPYWMSPEMIQEKPHDTLVDIWSLGIVAAEMMKGVVPHHRSKIRAMFLSATTGISFSREKKYSSHWSNELFDFLACCLQLEPCKRHTASELLKHPFINNAATKAEMLEILPLLFMSKTISRYS
ncbi:hypothetical protein SAMD00019534_084880, partial [Acytostelium subglobosum LB1]|uniref:hypothetical protein n=1 Tax=Acytostelium subglobosum LB1 TaxID=1410327 RepID=UPI00064491CA